MTSVTNSVTTTLVALVALIGSSSACQRESAFVVSLPSRVLQGATSDDVALCAQTTPAFVMDRPDIGGEPTLDVRMEPTDTPCVWTLPGGTELPRGVYTLLIRFDTVLTEPTACGDAGERVVIGAYAKQQISFPFPESFTGFSEEQFLSRPDDTVPNHPEIRFDPDGDGRDTLAEVSNAADPCAPAAPVAITLTPEVETAAEGADIAFVIEALGAPADDYEVVVTFAHQNGAAAGTEQALFTARSSDLAPGAVTTAPDREAWTLDPGPPDEIPESGSGRWRVVFRGDEPFVGPILVRAQARLDAANVLASDDAVVTVTNVDDPTIIIDEDGVPVDRLTFAELESVVVQALGESDAAFLERKRAELMPQATVRRIQVTDADLDDDVTLWQARLVEGGCPPFTAIDRDDDAFALAYAPQNEDAVLEAVTGAASCDIELVDEAGDVRSTSRTRLSVSPLKNNLVQVPPPTAGELGMPAIPFAQHTAVFTVIDPDAIEAPPACEVSLTPRAGTPCAAADAFPGADGVRCAVAGVREGDRWPFGVIVTPAADYFDRCGAAPSFDVSIAITDVSPDGSDAPLTLATCEPEQAPPACVRSFFLRTSSVFEVTSLPFVEHGRADLDVAPVIDGARGIALGRVDGAPGERILGLIELRGPTGPRVIASSPAGMAETFEGADPELRGAADEVNGRFLTVARSGAGTQVVVLVEHGANPANATWTSTPLATVCGVGFNGTAQAMLSDGEGNLYLACTGDDARIVRFNPDGTRTTKIFPADVIDVDASSPGAKHASIVHDAVSGTRWLVWPDDVGFELVDLGSIEGTLVSEQVALPEPWGAFGVIDAHVVDAERGLYIFVHDADVTGDGIVNSSDDDAAAAGAIRFSGVPTLLPLIDIGPASATRGDGSSRVHLMVRRAGAPLAPDGGDLLVKPGSGDYPSIDLDSFTLVGMRSSNDFLGLYWGPGVSPSPDRRYMIAPVGCGPGMSAFLYPWSGAPRQEIVIDERCDTVEGPNSWGYSESGSIGVFITGEDAPSVLWVFDFLDAAAGID